MMVAAAAYFPVASPQRNASLSIHRQRTDSDRPDTPPAFVAAPLPVRRPPARMAPSSSSASDHRAAWTAHALSAAPGPLPPVRRGHYWGRPYLFAVVLAVHSPLYPRAWALTSRASGL